MVAASSSSNVHCASPVLAGWLVKASTCPLCLQAGGATKPPELMSGASPGLAEPDIPENADKPQVPVRVPDVQLYLPDDAAGGASTASTPLMRQKQQLEVDASKAQQREAALSGVTSSVQAYNQLLARPHRMAIRH